VVLEKKLTRLKSTVEELRKAMTILGPVTPAEQLDERIKLRLTQLLGEWNVESGIHKAEEGPRWVKERSTSEESNAAETRDSARETKALQPIRKPLFGFERSTTHEPAKVAAPRAVTITPAAAMILKMSQEGVREKTILKQVNKSSAQFRLRTADQILYLRTNNVSSPVIAAMLNRDAALEESKR
jgi:hypothetical protein